MFYNLGMDRKELAGMIDQTLLSPLATDEQVERFCLEALEYGFASVCINPMHVKKAASVLKGSGTKVCTVVDFPLGAGGEKSKIAQADICLDDGAEELDFVVDLSLVKTQRWDLLGSQLKNIQSSVREKNPNAVTKLILETCVLSDEEIVSSCRSAMEAGFGFVKTSTGFYIAKGSDGKLLPNGATVHAVSLMRKTVGESMGVKASGGIHTTKEALDLIEAGASRIGASAGVQIVDGLK